MEKRFKDREYLKEYDLDFDLFKKFNLEIIDLIPVRKVFVAVSEESEYILKKVDYSKEEIYFIKYLIDSFKKNGFKNIFDFIRAKDGTFFIEHNGGTYIIMDYVEGRECQCSNPVDIEIATKGIAKLHKAGKNIYVKDEKKNRVGKLIEVLKEKRETIEVLKERVGKYEKKRIFDELFMDHVDYFLEQMNRSIMLIENGPFKEICSNPDCNTICHHDLAHHNILIHEEEAYFVDFDYSIRDLRIHDLCNFTNKVMKEYYYDKSIFDMIMEDYTEINPLLEEEKELLNYLLLFPEDFYSISAAYYLRHKNWDEITFIKRFEKKVDYSINREKFLSDILES